MSGYNKLSAPALPMAMMAREAAPMPRCAVVAAIVLESSAADCCSCFRLFCGWVAALLGVWCIARQWSRTAISPISTCRPFLEERCDGWRICLRGRIQRARCSLDAMMLGAAGQIRVARTANVAPIQCASDARNPLVRHSGSPRCPSDTRGRPGVGPRRRHVDPLDIKIHAGEAPHARQPLPTISALTSPCRSGRCRCHGLRRGDEVYGMTAASAACKARSAEFAAVDATWRPSLPRCRCADMQPRCLDLPSRPGKGWSSGSGSGSARRC